MDEINENKKTLLCIITCFSFSLGLIILILTAYQIKKKQYNDGYFLDVMENLNYSPIKSIILSSEYNNSCLNLYSKDIPIYKWKGNYFIIERTDLNYNDLISNNFEINIGTDSQGNNLYSNEKVINYIEINNSKQSSIDHNKYSVITQELDSNTYLHYSKDYTNGKILVDLKIGTEKKPCDDKNKNIILDFSKYSCKDNDLDLGNTYQNIDYSSIHNYESLFTGNQYVYLYSRTYISPPEKYKKYHQLKKIQNFAESKSITIIILLFISDIVNCICGCQFYYEQSSSISSKCFVVFLSFINLLIIMVCPLTSIILSIFAIQNYNNYNDNVFSSLNHGIKKHYKKYIWFIRYDIVILTFELILFIPNILRFISHVIQFGKLLGLIGEKVIDSITEKIKKNEERKERIKKYQEEIKELEKNPDIPISKINKKKLEFFKDKFHDALTCPISLDLFSDPVITDSGHSFEREYIIQSIQSNGNDPITRQPLKFNNVIGNTLVKKVVNEFNGGKNFNENIFNNIIELLKCPLSHKIFHEPYLAPIGNQGMTYERSYIENYIFNDKKDPIFNESFKGDPIKNFVVKDMVDSIIEMNKNNKDFSLDSIDKKTNSINLGFNIGESNNNEIENEK